MELKGKQKVLFSFISLLSLFFFSFFVSALNVNTIEEKFSPGEGVIISPDPVSNSTYYSNQTDYWGPYYYTLFADYPDWNTAFGWGDHSLAGYLTTRWLQGTPAWLYNDSTSLYFNETYLDAQLASTIYYANNSAVTGGSYTDTSDITDAHYYDGLSLNFTEGNGADPLDIVFNFTGVEDFSQLIMREYYMGSASHDIQVQIWDYDSSAWEDYFDFVGQAGYTIITIPTYDSADHLDPVDNNVTVRLHHVQNGITSHRLYIDYIWLVDGSTIGGSTNLDGYAKYLYGFNSFAGNGSFSSSSFIEAKNITTRNINISDAGNDWWTTISAYPDFVSSSSDFVFYNSLKSKWFGFDLSVDNPTMTCYNGTNGNCRILDDTTFLSNVTMNATFTNDVLTISSNETHINFDGGGKIICIGNC